MLQESLNAKVESFDLGETNGKCVFKLHQERDSETNKLVTVGAHNCKSHGIKFVIYMRNADWSERVERQFKVVD